MLKTHIEEGMVERRLDWWWFWINWCQQEGWYTGERWYGGNSRKVKFFSISWTLSDSLLKSMPMIVGDNKIVEKFDWTELFEYAILYDIQGDENEKRKNLNIKSIEQSKTKNI